MLMQGKRRSAGWPVWVPALLVAVCAVAATAHGLYEVAVAAGAPPALAWTYPASADGLALVAYASTHRLRGLASGYAWAVTVLAAGLSGLAQGVYLASDPVVAVTALRFGVGVWPALAAALVAHLLYLLATPTRPPAPAVPVIRTMSSRTVADAVATTPPRTVVAADVGPVSAPGPVPAGDDDLVERARTLLATGAGRGQVRDKLGVTDHKAKQLVKAVRG